MRQLKITSAITNREADSLEKYLQDIAREELIKPEEEAELARKIRKGDQGALERLTKANLRFVVSVAKQYQNRGLSLQDLINEGNLGLMKAASKFDETRGFKFISYAVWWIRQSIMQALADQSRLVRLPINQVGNVNKIAKALSEFEQEFERRPSVNEIADKTGMDEHKVADALKANGKHISVDAPVQDGEGSSLLDLMPSDDFMRADEEMERESMHDEIGGVLSVLNDREKFIVEAFFGIGGTEFTLEEIAQKSGLTRERVRQIKEKAIRKLRQHAKSNALKDFLNK